MATPEARARQMVHVLDTRCDGWRKIIDKDDLSMQNADNCPLTQIGIKMFGMNPDDTVYTNMLERFPQIDLMPVDDSLFCDDRDLPAFLALLDG